MQNHTQPNRKYKDNLFRFIFNDKKNLLSLYNAVNGSDYTDPEALEIYTMEEFIYMGMKNDLSFLIDSSLNLFEHQSTYNPNMPLRGYIYMAAALKKYAAFNGLDLYSSRRLELPLPQYYVFYNGTREMADETMLYLTDSMPGEDAREKSCAQFAAHMININAGHSSELMKRCPLLYEYSVFISEVRGNLTAGMRLKEAIDKAVDDCIQRGILREILQGHRAEVTDMLLIEYDEAFHISNEKEISYSDGFHAGVESERRNTEREKLTAERERQNAEKERQNAERERQNAGKEHLRAEIFRLKLQKKTDEEIATALELPIEEVTAVLS